MIKDQQSESVNLRIQGAVAADARYHVKCRDSFMPQRNARAAASKEQAVHPSISKELSTLRVDQKRAWSSLEVYQLYQEDRGKMSKKNRMANIYMELEEEIIVLSSIGHSNILMFKGHACSVIRIDKGYYDNLEDVRNIAKTIRHEVKSMELDRTK